MIDAIFRSSLMPHLAFNSFLSYSENAPFLIPEAALVRLAESGRLPEASQQGILYRNCHQLIEETRVD